MKNVQFLILGALLFLGMSCASRSQTLSAEYFGEDGYEDSSDYGGSDSDYPDASDYAASSSPSSSDYDSYDEYGGEYDGESDKEAKKRAAEEERESKSQRENFFEEIRQKVSKYTGSYGNQRTGLDESRMLKIRKDADAMRDYQAAQAK